MTQINGDFTTRAQDESFRYAETHWGPHGTNGNETHFVASQLAFEAGSKWRDAQPPTLTAADLEAGAKAEFEKHYPGERWETAPGNYRLVHLAGLRAAFKAAFPNIVLPESEK